NTELVVNDPPAIPPERLEELFRAKPKAASIFYGERNAYPSQSEADLGLASLAAHAGWSAQEICDLLVDARHNADEPIKPVGYFARTIAKAMPGTAPSENAVSCGAAPENGAAANRISDQGGAGV